MYYEYLKCPEAPREKAPPERTGKRRDDNDRDGSRQ